MRKTSAAPIRNVVFIMLDTLQFNYLGCYGNTTVRTPNFDRFARRGFLFENAYSEGLPTIPARRALMTGRFTLPSGGWQPLSIDDTTITDILWGRNIQTALVYDTPPMRLPKYGYSRGFDHVRFCGGHELDHETYHDEPLDPALRPEDFISPSMLAGVDPKTADKMSANLLREIDCYLRIRQHWRSDADNYVAVVAREADRWLRKTRDPARPFFLWVDSFDPHEPWDPPSVWDPDRPCPYDPGYDGNPLLLAPWSEVEGRVTDRECEHIRALYAEKVTLADAWMGRLLDSIREQGLWDETMIVVMSDHGQPLGKGEHGHGIMRKCRPWPYEELVHVPLLIHVPGLDGGRRIGGFVQNTDIAPTILDALGYLNTGSVTEAGHEGIHTFDASDMQGESLLPLMRGDQASGRDFAIAGYHGMSWSIITKDYSYIHWLKRDTNAAEMQAIFFDNPLVNPTGAGARAAADGGEEMWTCTPGAEVVLPEQDELYDRGRDPFQLVNIVEREPEKAKELLQTLKLRMGELRAS